MSDFAQTGLITTLQRLNDSHLESIEAELTRQAAAAPIAVILPCHARDLDGPALAHIIRELSSATWLDEVILSLNGLDEHSAARVDAILAPLPQRKRWLWNDRPSAPGTPPTLRLGPPGKGANVAAALHLLVREERVRIIATQDCDVASFRRADLARLCFPLATLGYRYAKAYYPRVTGQLYGRVTRLFLGPLLHACVRVAGHQPLLDFLLSFRYPLSGEVAMTHTLAASLPVAQGYALEINQLCAVFRHLDPRDVCQVGGGSEYEHHHQPAETGLARMAEQIATELFRQLTAEGLPSTPEFRAAVASAYRREAAQAIRRSAALARINALPFDEAIERAAVAAFADRLH